MDFKALIEANNKVINRKYNDAVDGQNICSPQHKPLGAWNTGSALDVLLAKRTAAQHVAEQLDRARIAREEAARTRNYNNK